MHNNISRPSYQHFVGVDVGKFSLVFCRHGERQCVEYPNSPEGIRDFFSSHSAWLQNGFFIVDTTGNWERSLIESLLAEGIPVHRTDGRRVKSFARSLGKLAKTDSIDAGILARYGHDRHQDLFLCELADEKVSILQTLVTRRSQLVIYAKEEKQRLSGKVDDRMHELICYNLDQLNAQIEKLNLEIEECIDSDVKMKLKSQIMQESAGIGSKTSAFLLAQLPELGYLNCKEIAALSGLAPHARDSGQMNARRTTYGGRQDVKSVMFLAAINAVRCKDSTLREFYMQLISKGKTKRCALIAVARKMITILNAKIRDTLYPKIKLLSR
jgi:transposase